MRYYEELIRRIDRSMRAHPRSTVVMDADSFKVLVSGKDPEKLTRKLRGTRPRQGLTVVFERPDQRAVWILATQPAL